MGPWTLAANVANIVIGAGIFAIPAPLYREAGSAAPLAYLACTAIMAGVVLCFAVAGSRVPSSAGPFGWADAAFGRMPGFVVAVLLMLGSVLAQAGVAAGLADVAGRAAPALANPVARALLIALLIGGLGVLNTGGVSWGAALVRLTTAVKLLPLALLLAGCAVFALQGRPAVAPPSGAHGGAGFGRAMLLAIFAFQGMETALAVSGEVRDPARSVPRGLVGAMAAISALYVLIQLGAQRVLGGALAGSAAALADVGAAIWPPLGALLLAGTAASLVGYMAGDMLSAPRLLFALGRDGMAPGYLGRLTGRGAPAAAILTYAAVGFGLAVTGAFEELVTLAALSSAAVYVAGCLAALVLQRRGVARAGEALRLPGLEIAAVVGIAGMIWLGLAAKWQEVVGLGAVVGVSALLYAVALRRRGRAGGG